MRFKQRKELADKYKEWAKQTIDNNQPMILDYAESVIAFLDINGYLNEVVRCKDCIHNHEHETPFESKFHICNLNKLAFTQYADFYCAYGERKEDSKIH